MTDKPELIQLSRLQIQVLDVLWARGEATTADVRRDLAESRDFAMTTVATLLARLEKKGIVSRRGEGRQFLYRAEVSRDQVQHSMVNDLTEALFRGNAAELVSQLLTQRQIDADELPKLRELIDRRERELRDREGSQ